MISSFKSFTGENRSIWRELTGWTKRKDRLVGHILSQDSVCNMVMEGIIWGKNGIGRPRFEYSKQYQRDLGCNIYARTYRID